MWLFALLKKSLKKLLTYEHLFEFNRFYSNYDILDDKDYCICLNYENNINKAIVYSVLDAEPDEEQNNFQYIMQNYPAFGHYKVRFNFDDFGAVGNISDSATDYEKACNASANTTAFIDALFHDSASVNKEIDFTEETVYSINGSFHLFSNVI